jgi:hypothetical protein
MTGGQNRYTVLEVPVGIETEPHLGSSRRVLFDERTQCVGLITKDDFERRNTRVVGGVQRAEDEWLPEDGLEKFGLSVRVLKPIAIPGGKN